MHFCVLYLLAKTSPNKNVRVTIKLKHTVCIYIIWISSFQYSKYVRLITFSRVLFIYLFIIRIIFFIVYKYNLIITWTDTNKYTCTVIIIIGLHFNNHKHGECSMPTASITCRTYFNDVYVVTLWRTHYDYGLCD